MKEFIMWYVKDEFSNKIYFKSNDLNKCQQFANFYNKTFKFCGQRMFKFNLYDFCGFCIFWESKIDINHFTEGGLFDKRFKHPLAIKNFDKVHRKYLSNKFDKMRKLCKKYHLWSYNKYGRKCDGFDF